MSDETIPRISDVKAQTGSPQNQTLSIVSSFVDAISRRGGSASYNDIACVQSV